MFDVCCRLCLEQTPLSRIQSLYGQHKGFSIRDKIFELFQIKFTDTEKLSTVCDSCLDKIETADSIRNFFQDSDKKFSKILSGSLYESEKVPDDTSTKESAVSAESSTNDDKRLLKIDPTLSSTVDPLPDDIRPQSVKQEELWSQESTTTERLDDIEILPSEEHELADSTVLVEEEEEQGSMVDICEHFSESEISVLEEEFVSELAESQSGRNEDMDGDIDEPHQVVMYLSDHSSDLISMEGMSKATDLMDDTNFVEVDNDKTAASLGVPGDEEINIVTIEFLCNACGEIFEDKIALIQHTNTVHYLDYPYNCRRCLLVFKTIEEITSHDCIKQPRMFSCSECSDRFQTVKALHNHTQIKHNRESTAKEIPRKTNIYKCDFCLEMPPNNHSLIKHIRLAHPTEFVLYSCDRCDKTFGNLQSHRAHMAAHEKNYECSHCGKVCPTAVSLAGHENTHTKDQPFQCTQCGRNFAQYTSMRRHMKIHFNEKAYQCDMCDKRFRQRSVMLTHRRIHTGEKPFCCNVCGKAFRDHSTLAKHKRIHDKNKSKN